MAADAGVIWGGVVPLRTGLSAAEAVRSWAVGCGARRLLLVFDGGRYPENAAAALIAALETAGVAVFPFDHAGDHAG
ncbi:MAG: hypothetical protein P1U88_16240, partial [Thalassobaculaceae bacterium]|nr:hypothetical protein [Thalassobaculaceae bacterium]